ncbi:iron chelate uptake ABC transporter family permease subunit [Paenibacillus farraposensis]|uniref:Iron chelate uptake ABC transporter family permease subunit n=1 Tax=Paenibacillus farraposensis TaxID=2807095 RepID=A0ABW4DGB3_9BACL
MRFRTKGRRDFTDKTRLLLSGIGIAAGISATMIIITLKLTPESYTFVANWLAGSIWGSNWKFVMALLPWLIILLPFVYYKINVMNVLSLGDQTASGLGNSWSLLVHHTSCIC